MLCWLLLEKLLVFQDHLVQKIAASSLFFPITFTTVVWYNFDMLLQEEILKF